ncbi:MAG: Serine/threonine protein kinase PrkC, regulator of stationary phase [Myxococcaceae bacterium]|nr:Serine/threonine protein kinase PrkC, regulator of stationary phase [Myxococcaceae bacterium]
MDESRSATAQVPRSTSRGTDPLIGRLINERYKILAVIAHGGMGKVYRAEQAPLGRLVALKVLSPNYNGESDPEFHKRFFLEASIASKLRHPNTVTIFDYGKTDDEVYYIAMELLEGRTLHRALRDDGTLSPERTVHIAGQICRALREAHGLGVIHRDLKPANVYLVKHGDENEFTKVLDFGLVKNIEEKGEQLTQVGLFMGSPKYMSPEQIRGETVDSRVDVYALGVMMYEMLVGKVPFDSPNSVNILMAHVHEQVPPMHELNPNVRIPPALEALVQKCMAKNPDDRYLSMNDVLFGLKQVLGTSSSGMTSTGEYRIPEFAETKTGSYQAVVSMTPMTTSGVTTTTMGSQKAVVQPFAQAAKPSNTAAPLFLAAVFGLTGIAGLFALSGPLSEDKKPKAAQTAASEPATTTMTTAQPTALAPRAPNVLVTLRSEPAGAMVLIGDREYGPTPTQLEWTGAEAQLGREVTFRFRRTGYRALTVTREVRGDRMAVEVSFMDPIPKRPAATAPGARAPAGAAARDTDLPSE